MDGSFYRDLWNTLVRGALVILVGAVVLAAGTGFLIGSCDRLPTVEVHWK